MGEVLRDHPMDRTTGHSHLMGVQLNTISNNQKLTRVICRCSNGTEPSSLGATPGKLGAGVEAMYIGLERRMKESS